LVAPLLALLGAVLVAKGVKPLHGWLPVVLVTLLLAAGAIVAVETGEDQEERVESIVPEEALELHEERAELLRNVAVLALLLALVGLLDGRRGWVGRGLAAGVLVGAIVVGWMAGETGGELVYRHGAANAYIDAGGPSRTVAPARLERHD
jgi:hypothetical protein